MFCVAAAHFSISTLAGQRSLRRTTTLPLISDLTLNVQKLHAFRCRCVRLCVPDSAVDAAVCILESAFGFCIGFRVCLAAVVAGWLGVSE